MIITDNIVFFKTIHLSEINIMFFSKVYLYTIYISNYWYISYCTENCNIRTLLGTYNVINVKIYVPVYLLKDRYVCNFGYTRYTYYICIKIKWQRIKEFFFFFFTNVIWYIGVILCAVHYKM